MKHALIAAIVACKSQPSAPTTQPPPDPLAPVLASAGAEPRRPVRYTFAKGTKAELELAIDASVKVDQLGSTVPTQVFDLDVVVDDVLPDGRMHLRWTIVDVSVRDSGSGSDSGSSSGSGSGSGSGVAPGNPLASHLATFKGITITATLSPDGKVTDGHLEDGDKPRPDAADMVAAFEHLVMPLPHDPIGAGARWVNARELVQSGIKATVSNTVDVTSFDGHKLVYRVATELHGPDQQVTLQGTTVDAAHIIGAGAGQGAVDLTSPASTGELSLELHADMTAQGEKSQLVLGTHQTVGPRK